jgi:ribonuclease P protein component
MLSKEKRIPRADFKQILLEKNFFNSQHFTLRTANSLNKARVSVSVSKKISKSAVVRNKVRRRVYSATNYFYRELKPNLYLIISKSGADKLKGENLNKELRTLFKNFL